MSATPTTTAPAPIGTASPARMTDQELTAEADALNAYQDQQLPGLPREERMPTLSSIGSRRGALTQEVTRRKHEAAKARSRVAEEEQRRARLARTVIGKRDDEGRYPLAVDGAPRATVRKVVRSWVVELDGAALAGSETTRWEAVDRVVQVIDQRTKAAREAEERTAAPEGWTLAGEGEQPEVGDVVRLANEYRYGASWGRPLRVLRRVVEPEPYGERLYLAELDDAGPGTSMAVRKVPRFVRPAAETAAAFPPLPFRHRDPQEAEARRLMGGEIGDELASLSRRPALPDRATRALEVLAGVEDGTSAAPAADMREVAEAAEAIRAATVAAEFDEHRSFYASCARAAHILATRYAERFEAGGGRLTPACDTRP
ncbi:hypothetical protein ACFXPX_36740 [Kitasatospora sp. NPDC059146]|uniref:hypothetical protein n=1 Tax=unclassified Kitasatospora TaxID=2633591 RepID=UPI00368EC81A